ncbi:MAG: AAA family ATPase [Methanohalobium sp.]|uniref:AAA family ATPase n=1 Tax=Methanohalobium sp. TaxID=2837493 RepID=UPI00397C0D96
MKIIAFVGMPASGKSEASSVVEKLGIKVVNMGDVIREEVEKRSLEPTDANVGGVANQLRDEEGLDVVAKKCVPKIMKLNEDLIAIDGIRGIAEVEYFKKEFGDKFTLVSIDSPIEMRFKRVQKRKRSDDMTDIDELKHRDEREISWGMNEAMDIADIVIENTGTLEDFRHKIKSLIEYLMVEVEVSAVVNPTENEDYVADAVRHIFGDIEMEIINTEQANKRHLSGSGDIGALKNLHEMFRKEKILDTGRMQLEEGISIDGLSTHFIINKQVASVGRLNFPADEEPLGSIHVIITVNSKDKMKKILDWLTPPTEDGRPKFEMEIREF